MQLKANDSFPSIGGSTIGGGELTIPEGLASEWNVVILYRGHW